MPRVLSLKFVHLALPGVWGGEGVNGPLWTIWHEVACYTGLAVGLSLLRSFRLFVLVCSLLFTLVFRLDHTDLYLSFVTGMAVYR